MGSNEKAHEFLKSFVALSRCLIMPADNYPPLHVIHERWQGRLWSIAVNRCIGKLLRQLLPLGSPKLTFVSLPAQHPRQPSLLRGYSKLHIAE